MSAARIALACAAVLLLSGEQQEPAEHPQSESGDCSAERIQKELSTAMPPGVDPHALPESTTAGARYYERYCNQCHVLPAPTAHAAHEWDLVVDRMNERIGKLRHDCGADVLGLRQPSGDEVAEIKSFLKKNALDVVPPEKLPLPKRHGIETFKRVCSRCHALPSPRLHTPEQWPRVVERMRINSYLLRADEPITTEETQDAVSYLKAASGPVP